MHQSGAFRGSDPDTSRKAAKSIATTDLEDKVLSVVASLKDGCIPEQVYNALPEYGMVTLSPRFAQLTQKGLIFDTGYRRTASSGRTQRILKAKCNDQ